jgi:hypothetical protein
MPYFSLIGSEMKIRSSKKKDSYIDRISSAMSQFRERAGYVDVVFHCNDGRKFGANKFVFANCSTFLQKIIGAACQCCGAFSQEKTNLVKTF